MIDITINTNRKGYANLTYCDVSKNIAKQVNEILLKDQLDKESDI